MSMKIRTVYHGTDIKSVNRILKERVLRGDPHAPFGVGFCNTLSRARSFVCIKAGCKGEAVNGKCEACTARGAERAREMRSEIGERISRAEETRSNGAKKAWATRRAAAQESEA